VKKYDPEEAERERVREKHPEITNFGPKTCFVCDKAFGKKAKGVRIGSNLWRHIRCGPLSKAWKKKFEELEKETGEEKPVIQEVLEGKGKVTVERDDPGWPDDK